MAIIPYTLFISHASEDLSLAMAVASQLEDEGVAYFLDHHHLVPGDDFRKVILDRIRASHEFLWLITPEAMGSPWLPFELGVAQSMNIRIIPMLHRISVAQFSEHRRWYGLVSNLTMATVEGFASFKAGLMVRVHRHAKMVYDDSSQRPEGKPSEMEIALAISVLNLNRRRPL